MTRGVQGVALTFGWTQQRSSETAKARVVVQLEPACNADFRKLARICFRRPLGRQLLIMKAAVANIDCNDVPIAMSCMLCMDPSHTLTAVSATHTYGKHSAAPFFAQCKIACLTS